MTVKDFFENNHQIEGVYAVYKSGTFYHDSEEFFGINACLLNYNNHGGFSSFNDRGGVPNWVDDTDESLLEIKLLVEFPNMDN